MFFSVITRCLKNNGRADASLALLSVNGFTGGLAVLLSTLLVAFPAQAASNVGFGVSFLEDGAAIYVPVNLTEYLRVEPVVSLEQVTVHRDDRSNGSDIDDRELAIGVGVFGLNSVSQETQLYYGVRLLHLRRDATETDNFSKEEAEYRGYQAHALAGLEYRFGSHFSIGGEAGLEYTDVDVTFRDTRMGRDEQSVTDTRTRTNLIARFYF